MRLYFKKIFSQYFNLIIKKKKKKNLFLKFLILFKIEFAIVVNLFIYNIRNITSFYIF